MAQAICAQRAIRPSISSTLPAANETGRLTLRTNSIVRHITVDNNTGKAKGVAVVDRLTYQELEFTGKIIIVAGSTLESTRLLLNSKSRQHPNGIGNSSGHVGHNFCEHVMGPGVTGLYKQKIGAPRTNDDGRPGGFYLARFRNLTEKHPKFIRGYGFEGGSGIRMFPGDAIGTTGFGAGYKKKVRDYAGAFVDIGGFGEVLSRYENFVELDPTVKDRWGIPEIGRAHV